VIVVDYFDKVDHADEHAHAVSTDAVLRVARIAGISREREREKRRGAS